MDGSSPEDRDYMRRRIIYVKITPELGRIGYDRPPPLDPPPSAKKEDRES